MVKVGITLWLLLLDSWTIVVAGDHHGALPERGVEDVQRREEQPRVFMRMERRKDKGFQRRMRIPRTTTQPPTSHPLITLSHILTPSRQLDESRLYNRRDYEEPKYAKDPKPKIPLAPPAPIYPEDPGAAISSSLSASAGAAMANLSSRSALDVASASLAGASSVSANLSAQITSGSAVAATATSQVANLSASLASLTSNLAATASPAQASASNSNNIPQMGTTGPTGPTVAAGTVGAAAGPAGPTRATASPQTENGRVQTSQTGLFTFTVLQLVGILVGSIIGAVLVTLLLSYIVHTLYYKRRAAKQAYGGDISSTSKSALRSVSGGGGTYPSRDEKHVLSPGSHPGMSLALPRPRKKDHQNDDPGPRMSSRLSVFDEMPLSGGDTAGFSFSGLRLSANATETDSDSPDERQPVRQQSRCGNPMTQAARMVNASGGLQRNLSQAQTASSAAHPSMNDGREGVNSALHSSQVPSNWQTSSKLSPLMLNPPDIMPLSAGYEKSWGSGDTGMLQEQPPNHIALLLAQPPKGSSLRPGHTPKTSQSSSKSVLRSERERTRPRPRSISVAISPMSANFAPPSPSVISARRAIDVSPISLPPRSPLPPTPTRSKTPILMPQPQTQVHTPPRRQRAPVPAALQRFLPDRSVHVQAPTSVPTVSNASPSPASTPRQATFSLFPKSPGSPFNDVRVSRQVSHMQHTRQRSSSHSVSYLTGMGRDSEFSTLSPRSADSEGRPRRERERESNRGFGLWGGRLDGTVPQEGGPV